MRGGETRFFAEVRDQPAFQAHIDGTAKAVP